jgi:hypothetical protein
MNTWIKASACGDFPTSDRRKSPMSELSDRWACRTGWPGAAPANDHPSLARRNLHEGKSTKIGGSGSPLTSLISFDGARPRCRQLLIF